jgi:putative SOS response-associated peptidase YedK
MTGRVKLPEDVTALKQALRIQRDNLTDYAPRWNVMPASLVPVVSNRAGARSLEWMRWGLLPSWATDERNLHATFNARADSVAAQPVFRDAWKAGRRCLVVTGGYYEWRKTDKQPFCVALADAQPMLMAGLWEEGKPSKTGEPLRSCTIITIAANERFTELHERMPVILAPEDWAAWLGEEPGSDPAALLKAFPAEQLKLWPVDKRLSNVKNEGRELAEPVKLPAQKR